MTKEEKLKTLIEYIKTNVGPILVDFITEEYLPSMVKINADCSIADLNGHYEGIEFVAPKWYQELTKDDEAKILLINNIDSINAEEQSKFVEIIKYRKVSTFELPKNTIIILTADKINKETINEEIYTLVAHIEG